MEAIGRALSAVDERDAKEWLAHHGYSTELKARERFVSESVLNKK
jgi:hypothetical protein